MIPRGWKALVLLGLFVMLFACATTEEPESPPVTIIDETPAPELEPESQPEVEPQPDTESRPDPDPEPGPQPEPVEPPSPRLRITEPVSLSELTTREFEVTAEIAGSDAALARIGFELLSGRVVTGTMSFSEVSDLNEELRRREFTADGGSVRLVLPRGVIDREFYSWRARGILENGETTDWTATVVTRLDLGRTPPTAVSGPATIDRTPTLSWQAQDDFTRYRIRLQAQDGRILGEEVTRRMSFTVPTPLPSADYLWSVSGFGADGIATAYSNPVQLRILSDARPALVWPAGGQETLGERVGLHWRVVPGAVNYDVEYRPPGREWISLDRIAGTTAPLPALASGSSYEWRARAVGETGERFSWSSVGNFVVGDYSIEFVPIVAVGDQAEFSRGYAGGSRDEQPVRTITLTRAYEMSRTVLTNADVARLVNFAIGINAVEIDSDGVYSADSDEPEPLLGLATMDYGEQLGLRYDGSGLGVVPGYENHPAVGITWRGAVQLANLLSFVEGREPAISLTHDTVNQAANGYRLPTEAEWEYAARGSDERLLPWNGALTGRVANYYRSFDPFEDVNEPFTGAGGPTSPVSFFDGTATAGFRTTSGRSPFGVLDLVGNTWEWCWDRYDPEYYANSDSVDPPGPERTDVEMGEQVVVLAVTLDPNQRVVRGTAWNSRAPDVRLTNRGRYTELGRSYSIGVRLVRAPE